MEQDVNVVGVLICMIVMSLPFICGIVYSTLSTAWENKPIKMTFNEFRLLHNIMPDKFTRRKFTIYVIAEKQKMFGLIGDMEIVTKRSIRFNPIDKIRALVHMVRYSCSLRNPENRARYVEQLAFKQALLDEAKQRISDEEALANKKITEAATEISNIISIYEEKETN